jgi:urease beta subunit
MCTNLIIRSFVFKGAVIVKPGKITLNEGRRRYTIKVTNNGDRPIQVNLTVKTSCRSHLLMM